VRINVKLALSAILVLTASVAQANDYPGHRHRKAAGLNRHATVHRVAPASPAWRAWDSATQPTDSMCPQLEGYPDCH
jgi:hypothetical protein